MTTYYTYHLYHKPTGLRYYGVRYSKNAKPTDLWTTYFTSSKYVKALIDGYGRDSFIYEVRRTFESREKAISWEHRVLRRLKVRTNEGWLNKAAGSEDYYTYEWKDSSRKKLSNTVRQKLNNLSLEERKERVLSSCCAPHTYTKERSRKISEATTGVSKSRTEKRLAAEANRRNRSPEQRLMCGAAHKGKTWKLVAGKRTWMEKNCD